MQRKQHQIKPPSNFRILIYRTWPIIDERIYVVLVYGYMFEFSGLSFRDPVSSPQKHINQLSTFIQSFICDILLQISTRDY